MHKIKVDHIIKDYKNIVRKTGVFNSLKSFFLPEYITTRAVDDISFNIDEGKIVGFIGKNGAGKSTTIKMLVGILTPTSGNVFINGYEPYKERKLVSKMYGVVFGQRTQLWWDIPVRDTLILLKEMYDVSDREFRTRIEAFSDLLDLQSFIDRPARLLSLGQRMRADLCAALIHNPEILLLDEPTIGLDVLVKEKIRDFIHTINKEYKTTVILTTHDVTDLEQLSQEIIIIDKGKVIYTGNLGTLKSRYGSKASITVFAEKSTLNRILDAFKSWNVVKMSLSDSLMIEYDVKMVETAYILNLLFSKFNIIDIKINETSTEGIIKNIYEEK